MDQDKFIKDWLEGKVDPTTPKDQSEGGEHKRLEEELEPIISASNKLEVPSKKNKAEAWDEFLAEIDEEEKEVPETKIRSISRYIPIGIAAALALLAVVYFTLPKSTAVLAQR